MGYRWESGMLVEAPEEAEFIRWLFKTELTAGLRKIVRKLDKAGTRTRKGKGLPTIHTLQHLVESLLYLGG